MTGSVTTPRMYGAVGEQAPRIAHFQRRRGARVWLAVGVVAAVGMMLASHVALSVARTSAQRTELSDLEDGMPQALQDMFSHINITEKKSWMTEVFTKAKGAQLLHPMGDFDPYTRQYLDGTSHEAIVRQRGTQAIAEQIEAEAANDMNTAQQAARDAVGTDAGCTHRLENQVDYEGSQSAAVSGKPCESWALAYSEGASTMNPMFFPSLSGRECRNPAGSKVGAWCYLEGANETTPDVEGVMWEYCDVGSRCAVDVPILHQLKASPSSTQMQQLRDVGSRAEVGTRVGRSGAAPHQQLVARQQDGKTPSLVVARLHEGGLPVWSDDKARKAFASKSWLPRLEHWREKPSGPSYMSSAAAQKQLQEEGLM